MRRALPWAGAALALALAAYIGHAMWSIAIPSGRFMQFDQAAHGVHGVKMAQAIREHDASWLLALIEERIVWPPLLPLIEAPAFLLFGNSINVAEGLMTVLLSLTIFAAYLAGRAFGGPRGMLVGALAAALLAASPMVQLFGTMIMTEMPGALLLLAAVAFYVRWRRLARSSDLTAVCVCTTLLFFLKYNYALLWIVPLVLNEIGHALPAWPALVVAIRRFRPTPHLVAIGLALVAVAALVLARNAGWQLGGRRLGVRLPLAALLAVVVLPLLVRPRATVAAATRALTSWSAGARRFFWLTLVPMTLWLASPTHVKGFIHFVVNREGRVPLWSLRTLTFYVEAFVRDYSPNALIGVVVLVLAVAVAWRLRRLEAEVRIVPLAMIVGWVLCTAHRFKSPRFFFTVPPLIWLAAALALALALEALIERRRPAAFAALAPSLGVVVLVLALAFGFRPTVALARFTSASTPETLAPVLDAIADANIASHGTVLFGIWNRMSPGLTEWHQLLRHPEWRGSQRPKNPQWYPAPSAAALVDSIAADPGVERVLVLDLPPTATAWAPAFEDENPWIHEVRADLERDPRFVHERREPFPESGYALEVFRRVR